MYFIVLKLGNNYYIEKLYRIINYKRNTLIYVQQTFKAEVQKDIHVLFFANIFLIGKGRFPLHTLPTWPFTNYRKNDYFRFIIFVHFAFLFFSETITYLIENNIDNETNRNWGAHHL